MNKFINEPDGLGALAGCLFWLVFLSAGAALVWLALVRLAGFAR